MKINPINFSRPNFTASVSYQRIHSEDGNIRPTTYDEFVRNHDNAIDTIETHKKGVIAVSEFLQSGEAKEIIDSLPEGDKIEIKSNIDAHDSTEEYLHIQPVILQYRTERFLNETNENGLLNKYDADRFHTLITGEGELKKDYPDNDYAYCIASDADGNVDKDTVIEWLKSRKTISEDNSED